MSSYGYLWRKPQSNNYALGLQRTMVTQPIRFNARTALTMQVDSPLVPRLSLSRIVEFAAIFSGITLVAGYIWMHLVAAIAGLPEQVFTISDYASSGVSTSIVVSALSFLCLLSYAITFPWEEPRPGKFLTRLIWSFCGGCALAIVALIVLIFWFDLDNPTVVFVTGAISAVLKISIVVALFTWVSKIGPMHPTMENLAIILALGIWATAANGAMAYASRARQPLPERSINLQYRFDSESLQSSDWYLLLSTEHNYYFMRRSDGAIKIISADKLNSVSKPGEKANEGNGCFIKFLGVCARIKYAENESTFSLTATIPKIKLN
ncbi:hypothetical protein ACCS42_17220 [Rhizobium ruizarguesonis]